MLPVPTRPDRETDKAWKEEMPLSELLEENNRRIISLKRRTSTKRVSTEKNHQAVQDFDLWVSDLRSLKDVMRKIEKVRGVLSVERVRG